MASVVLAGLVYIICEIYIDDALIYGRSKEDFLRNLKQVLERLHKFNVAANQMKTKLGSTEVEYVGHVIILKEHHSLIAPGVLALQFIPCVLALCQRRKANEESRFLTTNYT